MNVPGPREVSRSARNLRAEQDSAALYDALADVERDPHQSGVYRQLASGERRHAAFWEERLAAAGQGIARFRPSARTRLLIFLARRAGIGFIVPSMIAREMKDQED
jgi:vacuolar iron transporter family protein